MRSRPGRRLASLVIAAAMSTIGLTALSQPADAALSGPQITAGSIQLTSATGLCLDNTLGENPNYTLDTQLQVVSCGGGATVYNQTWTVEADGTIRLDDLCLSGPGTVTKGKAMLQPCTGAADQSWVLSGGEVQSATAGYCLAASGTVSGDSVSLTTCGSSPTSTEGWSTPTVSTQSQTLSAAVQLLDEYNFTGDSAGLFTTTADIGGGVCPDTKTAGNCWWYAANSFYALTDFAEQDPTSVAALTTQSALANTYSVFCGMPSTCPTSPNSDGSNDFATLENFQNRYFDDTGWWALAWVNAWELTGNSDYLYLAEELWNYITLDGWVNTSCGSSLIQFSGTDSSGNTGSQDSVANVIYLRLSAWLYLITSARKASQAQQYLSGASGQGGAVAVAKWLAGNASDEGTATQGPTGLISGPYQDVYEPTQSPVAIGSPGSRFMFADHLDQGTCATGGYQMWLNTEGMAVAGLATMYQADAAAGDSSDADYYLRLADNLADTVMTDAWYYSSLDPSPVDGVYYQQAPNGTITGPQPPTADDSFILSEPCDSLAGNTTAWPYDCNPDKPILVDKGIFMRALYCLNQVLPAAGVSDPTIGPFITANAASLWTSDQDAETSDPAATDLNQFGFNWDATSSYPYNSVILDFGTQTEALEALNANLGGSTAMC